MDLYFDESGNTGANLLDKTQPVASLASTNLDEATCRTLLAPLLKQGQAEAKYSKLKGRHQGQAAVLTLLNNPALSRDTAKIMVADKRFYLVAQLVDKLIEPALLEAGINAYAGDMHVSMARMFHFVGPHAFPHGGWERLLAAFEGVLRRQSQEAFHAYERELRRVVLPATQGKFDHEAALIFGSSGRTQEFMQGYESQVAFDPMPDLFVGVISQWMETFPGRFRVTHDDSKSLVQREPLIRELMTPLASRKIGYGWRTSELPLRIETLCFADSKLHAPLQLADVLAGAAMDLMMATLRYRPETEFHKQLRDSPLMNFMFYGIVAIPDFSRDNEPGTDDQSLVDGATEFLAESKGWSADK